MKPLAAINTELELARLAVDLGGEAAGGPLAAAEHELIAAAKVLPAIGQGTVDTVRAMLRAGGDPLGDTFSVLRGPSLRRDQGQFFTPPAIVEPMIDWALSAKPARFVDPGCGSGRYTAAVLRRDPAISVVAIDLDPLATLMTRAMLCALDAKSARVICESYLTADIGEHPGVTAWVGNPPYVRHRGLSVEVKTWAREAAEQVGHRVRGAAGLHTLFFLATVLHGRPGDIGCFVTSAEWIDVGYGSVVRDLFVNGMGGRALDLIDPKAVSFEDVMTTALITCFELGHTPTDVAIHLVDSPAQLKRLEGGKRVAAAHLAAKQRWSDLFRAERPVYPGGALGDLVRVHRGFATGANRFFLMSRDEARARGLSEWVKPAITSGAEIIEAEGVVRDGPERKVLLDLPADFDRSAHPAVDAYLAEGEDAGVDEAYLCQHRRPWYRVAPKRAAPIVASYMARQAPAFALNPDGLLLLNIGHGLYPRESVDSRWLDALVTSLNASRMAFVGGGRTYFGGLEKFEPREMEALSVPALEV